MCVCEEGVWTVKEYVNYVSMTEYGLDCQSRRSKSCVVNDGSLSTESSDWIPKYKQLSYSVYVRGSKNGRKKRADGRGKGHGHVHPCPLLTRFASSVNTAAQSYAVGFASQHGHGEGEGEYDTLLADARRRVVSLTENTGRMSGVEFGPRVFLFSPEPITSWLVYFHLNKKGRKPRVKSVTLQL